MNGEHHDHDQHAHAHPPADEQELRARLEEELKKITVRDVLVQTVVTLINLGGQRLGLSEATKDAADPTRRGSRSKPCARCCRCWRRRRVAPSR